MSTTKNKTIGKRSKDANPCSCLAADTGQNYEEITDLPNGQVEYNDTGVPIYGPCDRTTRHFFAPGHDAKLKGLLIKLHRQGADYHRMQGGLLVSSSPMEVARQLGWERFLTEGRKKVAKPVDAKKKAKVMESLEQGMRPTKVKVGRWVYPLVAVVGQDDSHATVKYLAKDGTTKQAQVKLANIGAVA